MLHDNKLDSRCERRNGNLGMRKLLMSRFGRCWGDAVLGVSSAVWLATQTRHNDAMRPPVPSKMGYWQFPHPLVAMAHAGASVEWHVPKRRIDGFFGIMTVNARQSGSFPRSCGGRLGWGCYRSRHRPHPALPPLPGEGVDSM